MKRLAAFVLLLSVSAGTLSAQETTTPTAPDPNAPTISFESTMIDYGQLRQGAEAIRTFKFTNTGKSDLVIASIKGECGCTSIPDSWPKGPIKPGASGTFEVKYDTSVRVGAFEKKITITSNASNSPQDVRIKGVVLATGG